MKLSIILKKIDEKRYGEYLKAIDSFLKSDRFKSYMNVNLESIIQATKIMPDTFEVRWMSNVKMYIYIWLYQWRKEKESKIRMFFKTTIVKIKKCIKGILK